MSLLPTPQTCRSCGAPVVWAATEKARAPFDAAPSERGTHAIVDGRAVYRDAAPAGSALHLSHFATCPHAASWRGR